MARIALFDLDRTLLDVNSGRLWVQSEWQRGALRARDVAWAAYWLGRYTLGSCDGLDRVFEVATRSVAGMPANQLQQHVKDWFDREVRDHLRPGARRALDAHRRAGDRLVLATSSTNFAARAAAEAYGMDDIVSTELEVVDGVLSGRIQQLALGDDKARACERWAERSDVDLADATFYTDSITDLALLERVGDPVAVHPDRPLRREALARQWRIVDWGTAAVG